MSRILIAEDERGIASFVAKGLERNGYETTSVDTGAAALEQARENDYDLMVLDLGLPDIDGLEVLTQLRSHGVRMPVVILTARHDVVAGFDLGADDYVTKPFRFEELLARVKARLRSAASHDDGLVLTQGNLTLDLKSRTVTIGDRTVELTAREFALIEHLLRHEGEVFSREQLLEAVWADSLDRGSNVVDVYILYLRRKLGDSLIETVRGKGWRLRTS